eukprot:6789142-Lingulodinium_polyedra.AAC.1
MKEARLRWRPVAECSAAARSRAAKRCGVNSRRVSVSESHRWQRTWSRASLGSPQLTQRPGQSA